MTDRLRSESFFCIQYYIIEYKFSTSISNSSDPLETYCTANRLSILIPFYSITTLITYNNNLIFFTKINPILVFIVHQKWWFSQLYLYDY